VTRLLVLVLVVLAVAGVVQRYAPADLLASPQRPFAGYGSPGVRTEAVIYPRHATGADDVRVEIDGPARRVVSQDSHADEFLYRVAPPAHVVGVSEVAYEPSVSNVLAHVERHRPIVATDVERILLADPDLVFSPYAGRSDASRLLRSAGVPVYRIFTMFETLDAIEAHIRLTGYLTGQDEQAAAEVARFRTAIDRAVRMHPPGARPRVLGLGGTYTYGRTTLFNDIVRRLGAENVAAANGLVGYDRVTDEHIVRWNPDWIFAGASRRDVAAARARLLRQPAIAATRAGALGHVVVFDYQTFLPLSPFTAALVTGVANALYDKAGTGS
jgi:iron complex transport system substrate-binding protein